MLPFAEVNSRGKFRDKFFLSSLIIKKNLKSKTTLLNFWTMTILENSFKCDIQPFKKIYSHKKALKTPSARVNSLHFPLKDSITGQTLE